MILAFPSFKRPSLRRRAQVSIEAKQERAAVRTSVLILGDHRQSLTVIRSLASAGFRVIFGSERASTVAAHSRFVSESWLHPPLLEAEEFVTTMVDFLEARGDVSHVFPVGESELDCLARQSFGLALKQRLDGHRGPVTSALEFSCGIAALSGFKRHFWRCIRTAFSMPSRGCSFPYETSTSGTKQERQ